MLAVASLKRSLEFDPVEQGVKRKRAEIKLSPTTFTSSSSSPPSKQQQQQSIFTSSSNKKQSLKSCSFTALTPSTDDIPMFTCTQTAQMCARLLREQDKSIREQYEQLLTTKLNEQYEQFVRYSHDNIHKNLSKLQLFHFGQQQSENNASIAALSYIS
jgi:predicted transcriptional regulator